MAGGTSPGRRRPGTTKSRELGGIPGSIVTDGSPPAPLDMEGIRQQTSGWAWPRCGSMGRGTSTNHRSLSGDKLLNGASPGSDGPRRHRPKPPPHMPGPNILAVTTRTAYRAILAWALGPAPDGPDAESGGLHPQKATGPSHDRDSCNYPRKWHASATATRQMELYLLRTGPSRSTRGTPRTGAPGVAIPPQVVSV